MFPDPRDEWPHAPDPVAEVQPESAWQEWWTWEFVGTDMTGVTSGTIRLGFRPGAARALWFTRFESDIGLVIVRDDDLVLPRRSGALVVRGEGLWGDLVCETPFEHWTIGMEAFGLRVDHVDDETGERLPVGLDLEWELTGAVETDLAGTGYVGMGDTGMGYAQDGTMIGEVLIGVDRFALDATSRRTHTWGQQPTR